MQGETKSFGNLDVFKTLEDYQYQLALSIDKHQQHQQTVAYYVNNDYNKQNRHHVQLAEVLRLLYDIFLELFLSELKLLY
jgi:hypothetical protein